MRATYLLSLSIIGDIFDKDTRNSLCKISLDLYLVIILDGDENTVSHKYVVINGNSILTTF